MTCCGQIIHGAVGIAKSRLHIDRAPEVVIAARREVCRTCDRAEKRTVAGLIQVRLCGECNCLIRDKSNVKSEKCPLGKWLATG